MFVKSINPLLRLFLLMGVIQLIYDKTRQQFEEKKLLVIYSLCVMILFQGSFYAALYPFNFSYGADDVAFVRIFVELLETFLWLFNNVIIVISIVTTRKTQCRALNKMLKIERTATLKIDWTSANRTLKNTVRRYIIVLLIYFLIFYPIAMYVCYVLLVNLQLTYLQILGVYVSPFQLVFGSLYQMIVYQKFYVNFCAVHTFVKKSKDRTELRQVMEIFCKEWVLSRKMVKSYRYSYIGCLICVTYLMSFYFYYDYLSFDSFGVTTVWQAITALPFVSCYYWGKVCCEVSFN